MGYRFHRSSTIILTSNILSPIYADSYTQIAVIPTGKPSCSSSVMLEPKDVANFQGIIFKNFKGNGFLWERV